MPGVVILTAPSPPADAPLGFCAVCCMAAKSELFPAFRQRAEKHEASGEGVLAIPLEVPKHYLRRAVVWSLIPSIGALAPVCWSHVAVPQGTGLVQAVPGFPNGGQGVPLLGQ